MNGPLLSIREVTKVYKTDGEAVHALRGVSFDVRAGEFIAITGPSGSGKTTLLDVLGCLSQPTSGAYVLAGENVHQLDDVALARVRNKQIGFVFQTFNLLPRVSVLDNVALPLLYARVPAAERRQRAAHVLERVGLGHRLQHRPNQLSGGQVQRVAIARALVTAPLVILADEPTGNLDSESSAEVMTLLGELHAQGSTILLVTHEHDIAAYARRVLQVRDGLIVGDEPQPGRVAFASNTTAASHRS